MSNKKYKRICNTCGKEYHGYGKKYCSYACIRFVKIKKKSVTKPVIKRKKIFGRRPANYSHGLAGTKFYAVWVNMRQRCNNKNGKFYYLYGGKGIKCAWRSFFNFREDMYSSYLNHIEIFGKIDTTIERIDSDKNYYKDNCRWATRAEQTKNVKGITLLIIDGKIDSLQSWSKHFNVAYTTVLYRLKHNYGFQRALGLPLSKAVRLAKNYYLG